jgi:hypothetical protein
VLGLVYVASAWEVPSSLAELGPAACTMMAERSPRNFAVRAKIAETGYGLNSMELERQLGQVILDNLRAKDPSVRVKLTNPEATCWVEIVPGRALIYTDRVEAPGGLPAASSGGIQDDATRLPHDLRAFFRKPVTGARILRGRGGRNCADPHSLPVHFTALPGFL